MFVFLCVWVFFLSLGLFLFLKKNWIPISEFLLFVDCSSTRITKQIGVNQTKMKKRKKNLNFHFSNLFLIVQILANHFHSNSQSKGRMCTISVSTYLHLFLFYIFMIIRWFIDDSYKYSRFIVWSWYRYEQIIFLLVILLSIILLAFILSSFPPHAIEFRTTRYWTP